MFGPSLVALFDDGTLTGADRVRLARQCGDPLILPIKDRVDAFPTGPDWALLLAALDQRRNAYWVTVGGAASDNAVPDLARAIGSNRSFAIIDDGKAPAALRPHLKALARDGFPYIGASPCLLGFAACSDGLAVATAVLARLEAVLGERARRPDMACILAGFVLAQEREPVLIRDNPGAVHSPGRISML
jgi:hypothetical protein